MANWDFVKKSKDFVHEDNKTNEDLNIKWRILLGTFMYVNKHGQMELVIGWVPFSF